MVNQGSHDNTVNGSREHLCSQYERYHSPENDH